MTSKREQKITNLSIYFFNEQIPKEFKVLTFDEFPTFSVCRSKDRVLISLSKISHLNLFQKNYQLLIIGSAVANYFRKETSKLIILVVRKLMLRIFFLDGNSQNTNLTNTKQIKKKINMQKFLIDFKKKLNLLLNLILLSET